jgi:hypothetical protein
MKQKEKRQKIWLISGGDEYTKVIELMRSYSDGLNISQDLLKSNVENSLDSNGDPVFSIVANGHLIVSVRLVMNYSTTGFMMHLKLNHLKREQHNCFNLESLEKIMDDAISGQEMGSYIAHLMAIESRIRKNRISE